MGTGPQEREPLNESPQKAKPTGSTIPGREDGVGLGASEDANTFEPEEDPEATADQE
ncbi:hypothetical protein [Sinomonas mesophila]|uniref:hypothetical protein n=1 Tax=Sinomonas mesophila TaxID=1531955 RepID=UPI00158B6308|nr:hypothetical protein [Sinomonas mesophila]